MSKIPRGVTPQLPPKRGVLPASAVKEPRAVAVAPVGQGGVTPPMAGQPTGQMMKSGGKVRVKPHHTPIKSTCR